MATETLTVLMGDRVAGTLTRLAGGQHRFQYAPDYAKDRRATPLSVAMPLAIAEHTDRVVTPWLWGLLPDNADVLTAWAHRFGASRSSPSSLLATPVGQDCPGAVWFVPVGEEQKFLDREASVTWLTEAEVGERIAALKADKTAWLGTDFEGRFSLGGAQAKTALLCEDGKWGVPTGRVATTHILKPAIEGFTDHHINEHLCLLAARFAGLPASKSFIQSFAGEAAVVVERYDRQRRGSTILRVHQEDMCQALSVLPERKYEADGGPGAKQIVQLLRAAMPAPAADTAVAQFVDALIWNWLIAGTDAHAKNYSLLLAGGAVRLAPLYDLASGLPYAAHEKKLRLAMRLGTDYRIFPFVNRWPEVADELNLDANTLTARVIELADAVPESFASAAAQAREQGVSSPLIDRIVRLVTERSERCSAVAALESPSQPSVPEAPTTASPPVVSETSDDDAHGVTD